MILDRSPRGITLLEVILALAILAGALVLIGEQMRIAGRHATASAVLSEGQLHCQSIMNQLDAGILALNAVQNANYAQDSEWVYSIAIQPQSLNGLLAVEVSVQRQDDDRSKPLRSTIVRWMVDPAFVQQRVNAAAEAAEAAAEGGAL